MTIVLLVTVLHLIPAGTDLLSVPSPPVFLHLQTVGSRSPLVSAASSLRMTNIASNLLFSALNSQTPSFTHTREVFLDLPGSPLKTFPILGIVFQVFSPDASALSKGSDRGNTASLHLL